MSPCSRGFTADQTDLEKGEERYLGTHH
uniref:Uncharacterized protein n=1 Tax=Anguilla anguilla TaxID=7936 RepID=A0A0E9UEH8_ANGAN